MCILFTNRELGRILLIPTQEAVNLTTFYILVVECTPRFPKGAPSQEAKIFDNQKGLRVLSGRCHVGIFAPRYFGRFLFFAKWVFGLWLLSLEPPLIALNSPSAESCRIASFISCLG